MKKKPSLRSLNKDKRDPQSRQPLNESALQPFPELLPLIYQYSEQRAAYLLIKKKLISDARTIVNQNPIIKNPALFLCPISHQLIETTVISKAGKVYDKNSLEQWLNTYNNKENEQNLSLNDSIYFSEFHQQIKLYKFYLSKEIKIQASPVQNASGYGFLNLEFLNFFFGPSQAPKNEQYPDSSNSPS